MCGSDVFVSNHHDPALRDREGSTRARYCLPGREACERDDRQACVQTGVKISLRLPRFQIVNGTVTVVFCLVMPSLSVSLQRRR